MTSLTIVIGAGASYDCASPAVRTNPRLRPPLVTQLFSANFEEILHEYPLAEAAAPDVRRAVAQGSVAIEAFLRERLRNATDPYARRRFRQVPLYLQDLLTRISNTADHGGFALHPDNYDVLVSAALALDEVTFISLNYDTLLDSRLFIYSRLESMDSYVAHDRNWALIKLHGSVNWGRPIRGLTQSTYVSVNTGFLNRLFDEAPEVEFEDEIVLRRGTLSTMRYQERQLYYPALSVPLGSADELVSPASHVDFLAERLAQQDPLDLLVIGYSGLDEEVLRMLRDVGKPPEVLVVVNGSPQASHDAAYAIMRQFFSDPTVTALDTNSVGVGYGDPAFGGGLTDFVTSGALDRFFSSLS